MAFTVYNTEPLNYSPQAKKAFSEVAIYRDGSINELQNADLTEVNGLVVRLGLKIDKQILDKLPNLKFISSATTGLDHIDLEEAARRDIKAISLRGEDAFLDTIPSTAEHTFALLLALLRHIPQSVNDVVANGNWKRDNFKSNQLFRKKIGIVGFGRIGSKVAKYARAFDMEVGFYDPFTQKNIPADFNRFDSIEELAGWCNILSVHVHLTAQNRHLISQNILRKLQKGSWLINTSRGGVVDEEALAQLIINETLAGVAVDVLSNELSGKIEENTLWQLANKGYNVIITPHTGGASYEAMEDCEIFMAKKTVQFIKTLKPAEVNNI